MKQCVRCKIEKELDCFAFVKGNQLNTCKKCRIEINNRSCSKHRSKYVKYQHDKRNNNELHNLKNLYRSIPNNFLKDKAWFYSSAIGLDYLDFISYLESQFEPWMNWKNRHSLKATPSEPYKFWTIDHIIPMSSAKTEEDMIKLTHYTNLRPICSFINFRIKRNNDKYYEISNWLELGYRTEISDSGVRCLFKDNLLGEIHLKSTTYDIIKTFEPHRVKEYIRQVS